MMSQGTGIVCRTCLRHRADTRSVYATYRVAGNYVKLVDILANFFQYHVDKNDGLPQDICLTCTHQLMSTYSFNVLAQESLNKLYNTKVEFSESHDEQDNYDKVDSDSDIDIKPVTGPNEIKDVKVSNSEKIVETTQPSVLYCVECKKSFKSGHALLQHSYEQHPLKRKVGRDCEYCNEKFKDLRSLVVHRKFHFSLHVCEVCWDGFNTKEDLQNHTCKPNVPGTEEEVKTEPERIMRQCDQCGKSYPVGYIKLHMMIHSNERRYSCSYCPKKFKVRCSLNSHVLWNHTRTRNHKCDVCGASFVTASAKSAHKRKHHLLEKKHICENCGKKFFSKSEMQRHMLTHSGVKNFHCHLCDKSYQTRYGLNVHLKSSNSHPISM